MRIELGMEVRGDRRTLRWEDGALTGDDEVLRRLQPLIDAGRVQPDDLVSVVRGTEQVTAQHVEVLNLDLVEGPPAAVV
jgi:hypothetical protein